MVVTSPLYTADFTTMPDQNPLSDGGKWSILPGNAAMQALGGFCVGTTTSNTNTEFLSGIVLPSNQYALAKFSSLDTSLGGFLWLRNSGANDTGDVLIVDSTKIYIYSFASSTYLLPSSTPFSYQAGMPLAFAEIGADWYVLYGGAVIFQGTGAGAQGTNIAFSTNLNATSSTQATYFEAGTASLKGRRQFFVT